MLTKEWSVLSQSFHFTPPKTNDDVHCTACPPPPSIFNPIPKWNFRYGPGKVNNGLLLLKIHFIAGRMRVLAAAVLTASQCFNRQSTVPKVMFGCSSPNHMIKILRAFHGVRHGGSPNDVTRGRRCDGVSGNTFCSYCPGDCVDDSVNEVCNK